MSGGSSPAKGAMRAVGLALILITVVVFATAGYSLYQVVLDHQTSDSPPFGGHVTQSIALENGSLYLTTAGPVSNDGLYPIEYSVYLNATLDGESLGNGSSPGYSVGSMQSLNLNSTFGVSLYSGIGPSDVLFYNGGNVEVAAGYRTDFLSLLNFVVVGNYSTAVPPVMGELHLITSGASSSNGSLTISLSFENEQDLPVSYGLQGSLDGVANSTTASGVASPGVATTISLVFPSPGQASSPGSHMLALRASAFGHEFVTEFEVVLA